MEFQKKFEYYRDKVNSELEKKFSGRSCLEKSVYDAMHYSITAGGKRVRPVLAMATGEMLGGDIDDLVKIGCALECIHTYSLIHDDLPCMDNDDLRRGRLTCHKKFNEETALLAGDGLLTFAFEMLTDFSDFKTVSAETLLEIALCVAKASGCAGMIGGQVVDLANEGKQDVTEELLTYMHNKKTGALIKCSVISGALAAGANKMQTDALSEFAGCIGLAFQVQDDILDCIGDVNVLGKPIGSDEENKKSTYVSLLGLEAARQKAEALTRRAIASLDIFGDNAEFLRSFSLYLMNRSN